MPGVKWEHGESPIATDIGELGYKVCGINYNVSNSCPARRLAKVCFYTEHLAVSFEGSQF